MSFWPEGCPVEVLSLDGCPRQFRWNLRLHRVLRVSDHWRVHTGWWATEVWRDYWQVTTHTGLLCDIYHDLLAGNWLLERTYG